MRKPIYVHYVENLKKYLILSGSIFLIGIIIMAFFGPVLDIGFKGGSELTYSFTGNINNDVADKTITDIAKKQISITENTDISGKSKKLVISMADDKSLSTKTQEAITTALKEKFSDNKIQFLKSTTVNPSLGKSFFLKSLYAMAVAAVLVIVYVAIRFRKIGGVSAGVTALIALVHDILIAFFVCVIFRLPIDDNFVAVVLTILGYSLNDTIVIYDRIRENRKAIGKKVSMAKLVDDSINQVIGRTIMTSLATFLAISTVWVVSEMMGLTTLRSLTIPMSIGVISGSYSTICLAGPLWVKWQDYKERKSIEKKTVKKSVK